MSVISKDGAPQTPTGSISMLNPIEGPFWGPETTVQEHVGQKRVSRLGKTSSSGNRWDRLAFDLGGAGGAGGGSVARLKPL